VLFIATLTAIRFNRPVRALYQRLTQAGRLGMLALTACMRKLLGHPERDEPRSPPVGGPRIVDVVPAPKPWPSDGARPAADGPSRRIHDDHFGMMIMSVSAVVRRLSSGPRSGRAW
jgi:hypothetical protein